MEEIDKLMLFQSSSPFMRDRKIIFTTTLNNAQSNDETSPAWTKSNSSDGTKRRELEIDSRSMLVSIVILQSLISGRLKRKLAWNPGGAALGSLHLTRPVATTHLPARILESKLYPMSSTHSILMASSITVAVA